MANTSNELILLKEMLKESFRNILREELPKIVKEELESLKKQNSKDLKEVKLLLAGHIKESRKVRSANSVNIETGDSNEMQPLTEASKAKLGRIFNKAMNIPRTPLVNAVNKTVSQVEAPQAVKNILLETAAQMSTVPDDMGGMGDMGVGEISDDPRWGGNLGNDQANDIDYGEIDETTYGPDFPY